MSGAKTSMLIREIAESEKELYNSVVHHPLQSWEWGEFKKKTGTKIERIGFFDEGKIVKGLQVSFHQLPMFKQMVGYFPKGEMPDGEQLKTLEQLAKKHKALFIKMEPDVAEKVGVPSAHDSIKHFLEEHHATPGRPLFTKYTFQIDLKQTEEKLSHNLKSKTRYNINLAIKRGVQIYENTTQEGMNQYIEILKETTKRQGFYAHNPEYFQQMWDAMGSSGIMRIFNAVYEGTVLVSWIMFVFNGVLYYPYGASRNLHREVMASNLMLWEMMRFGQRQGCHTFDLWGSLGPNASSRDPWFGFHKFKEGYGGDLMRFLGSYDVVYNFPLYSIFRLAENVRWKWLRLRARVGL